MPCLKNAIKNKELRNRHWYLTLLSLLYTCFFLHVCTCTWMQMPSGNGLDKYNVNFLFTQNTFICLQIHRNTQTHGKKEMMDERQTHKWPSSRWNFLIQLFLRMLSCLGWIQVQKCVFECVCVCVCVCVCRQLSLAWTGPLCETTERPFFTATQTHSHTHYTLTEPPPTHTHTHSLNLSHSLTHTNTHTEGARESLAVRSFSYIHTNTQNSSIVSLFLFLPNTHTVTVSHHIMTLISPSWLWLTGSVRRLECQAPSLQYILHLK